ncbi:MAG: FISUMP domain-containing protein, partial [Candidatus Cloacimonetes bacterium]|nr:FISUMP domain-containing protein [Candidatus Cloacimonadota bacterium]
YNITGNVATPTFNPVAGTYTTGQSVTISCATSGATIRYTTNGSDPTPSSPVYSSPVNISSTTTLKAKAFKTDWNPSSIATAQYTITGIYGTVTDIDGNVYQTLIIGNQEWMVENLKVTRYRNGDQIPTGHTNSAWGGLSTGAYCVYNNDPSNANTYGNLYNWYAVTDTRGLAPAGWRVPSDNDIKQLEMALGMTQSQADATDYRGTNQGSQLAGRADLWTNGALENDPQFGSSGFNFLSGGYRSSASGGFYNMALNGYFWTSTEDYSYYAWHRKLYYDITQVHRYYSIKRDGLSVRCVRDVD